MRKISNVDVIVLFDQDGIHPIRFKLHENDEAVVIKVDYFKILGRERHGEIAEFTWREDMVFDCKSRINGRDRRYRLKFSVKDFVWELWE